MNPIPQCFQKISPGNHFRMYGTDVRMYVRTDVRTDKGDAICPPIINGGGITKSSQISLLLEEQSDQEQVPSMQRVSLLVLSLC